MLNNCIVDIDDLLKKSYGKLKVHNMDNLSVNDFIITMYNNFTEYFPEIKILKPSIILSKTVAFYLQNSYIVLAKDKIYDFIIITYNLFYCFSKNIENFEFSSKITIDDNNLFDVCNDILYFYEMYDDHIKIQIPNLIVDTITILFFKSDPYGNRITNFQIKSFYKSKKESLINKDYSYPLKVISNNHMTSQKVNADNKTNMKQEYNKIETDESRKGQTNLDVVDILNNNKQVTEKDLLFKLHEITKRDIDSIGHSLSKLSEKEIKKLYDICSNYNKIIKYNQINNIQDFKLEIERELNRTLSDKQIRHSQISIKKVRFYIENLLDSKFEKHLTHGINHVKHNFEYGYRLAGLLENSLKGKVKYES